MDDRPADQRDLHRPSFSATAVLFACGLQQREWTRVRAVVSGGPFVTSEFEPARTGVGARPLSGPS
jgi:hypothetical protein